MFALGGGAFPNDIPSLCAALALGVKAHGASGDPVEVAGGFPSLDTLRMNLTGVRLDSMKSLTPVPGNAAGGCFARALDITAEPALLASVPIQLQLHAEDCVFTFGTAADGRRAMWLQSGTGGMLDVGAATGDIEAALLILARDAASKHGAEVKSVRLTLEAETPRRVAVTAIAVAKAMFLTATLTIRGRIALDDEFNLCLSEATCTGDGMLANLAAAQLRPRLTELEGRGFSLRSFLPAGLRVTGIALTGGAALQVHTTFGTG